MTKIAMLAFLDEAIEAQRQRWLVAPNSITKSRLRSAGEAMKTIREAIVKFVPVDAPPPAPPLSLFKNEG